MTTNDKINAEMREALSMKTSQMIGRVTTPLPQCHTTQYQGPPQTTDQTWTSNRGPAENIDWYLASSAHCHH